MIDVPGLPRFEIAPHHCFACGTLNTHGLHLDLHVERGRSWVELTYEGRFQGWDGIAHGGILATILDEVMAWAPASHDAWAVTAEMHVRFRSPANPGERLAATGRVIEKRRRIYRVDGEIRGADGRLVASATGRFLGASPTEKGSLKDRYGMPRDLPVAGARP